MATKQDFFDELAHFYGMGRKSKKQADFENTANFLYYRNWAMKKILSRFDFTGVPENWDHDYFVTNLFDYGFIGVTDTSVGVVPLICSYTGINIYSHPTTLIFANPVLGSFERTIGVDSVLMKIQYDYNGVRPLVDKYANALSMVDSGIAVNVQNSKVAFIGWADSKAQAESMKRMYDDISAGVPSVYVRESTISKESFIFNNVKQSYIGNDLENLKRMIKNDFLSEIGLNNANTEKRERLVTDEVNANNEEIRESVQHWLDNIREGLEQVRKLFDIDITVKLREYGDNARGGEDAENV